MPTLVYGPEVRIRIATRSHGTIDVSDDITRGGTTRILNGVSSMQCTLLNQSRKYDGVFTPMDRVVVYLKRLRRPLLVFSGYLDSVPIYSAMPGSVSIRASCTLKVLQNFLWDPGAEASVALIERALGDPSRGEQIDGGFAGVAISLMEQVVGWNRDKIHIAALPQGWLDKSARMQQQ